MAGPIYSLFLGKPTEAWYQLTQEERDALMAKIEDSFQKVGGKHVVMCNSRWSSEQWAFFGVQELPDIEAAQKHVQDLEEMNWYRYVQVMSVLGAKWEEPS